MDGESVASSHVQILTRQNDQVHVLCVFGGDYKTLAGTILPPGIRKILSLIFQA